MSVWSASGEGVHPRERQIPGTVVAERGGILALDDGEGGVDVADVIAVCYSVEAEVDGIEFGPQVQAPVVVPREGRPRLAVVIDVAEFLGEGRHVVCSVGEFENGFLDDLGGSLGPEGGD